MHSSIYNFFPQLCDINTCLLENVNKIGFIGESFNIDPSSSISAYSFPILDHVRHVVRTALMSPTNCETDIYHDSSTMRRPVDLINMVVCYPRHCNDVCFQRFAFKTRLSPVQTQTIKCVACMEKEKKTNANER